MSSCRDAGTAEGDENRECEGINMAGIEGIAVMVMGA